MVSKRGGTLKEVRQYINRDIPVIVGWYAFHGDHFSVIYSITKKYVYMMDTESHLKNGKRRLTVQRFQELWFDFDNPKKPAEKTKKWFMVLLPKKK